MPVAQIVPSRITRVGINSEFSKTSVRGRTECTWNSGESARKTQLPRPDNEQRVRTGGLQK